ncbi:MAG: hypothetical protein ABT11_19060, partial [Novosphingobium sp. SCN 66-18]
ANWQFVGAQDNADTPPPALPQFDRLVVHDGRIRIDDAPAKLKLDTEVRTDEGQAAPQGAGLQVSGKGSYEGRALSFRATSSGAMPIAAADAQSPPLPLTLAGSMGQARLEFDGHAADIVHLRSLDGDYTLSGPSLAAAGDAVGVTLPTTAAFEMRGKLRKADQVWSTEVASLSVGASRLAGEFSYDPRPEVPLLNGSLHGERLVLADLAPAIGAPPRPTRATGAAAAARRNGDERSAADRRDKDAVRENARAQGGETGSGKASSQSATPERGGAAGARGNRLLPQREFDIPSLRAMNASVKIALRELDLSTEALEPLRPLEGMLTLNNGLLKIDELRAGAAGGRVSGMLSLDSQPAAPVFATDLKWSGVDLDRWLTVRNPNAKPQAEQATAADAHSQLRRARMLGDLVSAEEREALEAKAETASASLEAARVAVNVARLNLERTLVRATVNGYVANLLLKPGDYLAAGAQGLAVVDADTMWIDGYFEETKLPRIHVGDRARVLLMGETSPIEGRVESIAPGIDDRERTNASNQLASVNPTFNWVRLAQRVPVRIALVRVPQDIRLIAGRTATVDVIDGAGRTVHAGGGS